MAGFCFCHQSKLRPALIFESHKQAKVVRGKTGEYHEVLQCVRRTGEDGELLVWFQEEQSPKVGNKDQV